MNFAMAGNFASNDNGVTPTITANNNEHQCRNNGPRGRPLTAGAHEGRAYASGDPIITSNKIPARGSGRAQLASFNFPNSLIWHLRQELARWRLPR
jgi:hypothetical protein